LGKYASEKVDRVLKARLREAETVKELGFGTEYNS